MSIEKRGFFEGMNMDLDEAALSSNMYRYALNIRNGNSEQGAEGVITIAEGNQEVSISLPSGGNRVIMAYDDEANDRVLYMVYNSDGNNRFLGYDYKNSVINTIVSDSGNTLGLSPNFLITSCDVIRDDVTTYALFCDDYSEPKNIDIEAGIRTWDTNQSGSDYIYRKFLGDFDAVAPSSANKDEVYSRDIDITDSAGATQTMTIYYRCTAGTAVDPTSGTTSYTPQAGWEVCPAGYIYGVLASANFTNIVTPHLSQPSVEYSTSANDYNYLYGNLYQYKVRYITGGGRRSAWSPINKFVDPQYPADSHLEPSSYKNISKYNNRMSVFIDVPDTSIFKTVEIAIRRAMNDKSPDDWQLAGKINLPEELEKRVYSDKLQVKFVYDGTTPMMPLDQLDAIQLMSWVPKKARAQAITSKNRVVYANFVEGQPFTLDGQYDINQNPPQVKFYERDNPFDPITGPVLNTFNTTTSAYTTATQEGIFNPVLINTQSGVAFAFPSSVETGRRYQINLSVEYESSTGGNKPIRAEGGTPVTVITETTTVDDLLDDFVTEFENNREFYIGSYEGEEFNLHLVEASSANSGGVDYLILLPPAAATSTSGSVTITPSIRKVPTTTQNTLQSIQSFKRGTVQTFGIVYADDYGRVSSVITHPQFSEANPWWKEEAYSGATSAQAGSSYKAIGQRYARLDLNHDAPSWATKYYIVKSLSNGITNYVSCPLSFADELPKLSDGGTNSLTDAYFFRGWLRPDGAAADVSLVSSGTSLGGQDFIYLPLGALQGSQFGYTNLSNTGIAYDFSKGDRVRLCYNMNGSNKPVGRANYYDSDADAEIVGYYPEQNVIVINAADWPDSLTGSGNQFAATSSAGAVVEVKGALFEIYSPQKERKDEFFHEIYQGTISAETANSRYYHEGDIQNQTSAQSAIIELTNGDCFLKPRSYTYKYDSTAVASGSKSIVYYVEEANYYDKQSSKTWGAGRPNRVVRSTSNEEDQTGAIGETRRETTLRYSEPFLPEQGFNGAATIHDLNFQDANGALKSIQQLHTEGSRLIIFHENAVGWCESDRSVVTTLDGNNMTIAGDTPLSDVVYYGTRAGIGTNPESFAFNDYRKYFVDVDQGQVCRLSQDGVTPISEAGMNKYFKSVFRSMINSPQQDYAFGAYDKRTDEYTLVLKWTEDIEVTDVTDLTITNSGATVVYSGATVADYDFYVSQLIDLTAAAIADGATYYDQVTFAAEVTAVTSTTVTFAIPLTYRNHVDELDDGAELSWYLRIAALTTRTITWSEKLKAWSSFHSFKAENLASAGMDFVSFRAGKIYTHDDTANPMSYYGTDYDGYIDIISNPNPDQVKVWKTAALKATAADAIVVESDFLIPVASADTTGAIEPVTGGAEDSRGKVTTGQAFVYKEGQIYSPYMRVGTGVTYSDFLSGDNIRGYWLRTRFKVNSGVSKMYKIISATFDYIMSNYTR
jgi:hypothetical protein